MAELKPKQVLVEEETMIEIAEEIRKKYGSEDRYTPKEIVKKIIEMQVTGEKIPTFWDYHQDFGKRTNYKYGFAGRNWEDKFRPEYDIIPEGSSAGIFKECTINDEDMNTIVKETGIKIDFSKSLNMNSAFDGLRGIKKLVMIELGKHTNTRGLIANSDVTTVEIKLPVNDARSNEMGYLMFNSNSTLTNVTFIGDGTIDWNPSPNLCVNLTKESIDQILKSLRTFNKNSKPERIAFNSEVIKRLTEEQLQIIIDKNWTLE